MPANATVQKMRNDCCISYKKQNKKENLDKTIMIFSTADKWLQLSLKEIFFLKFEKIYFGHICCHECKIGKPASKSV